MPENHRNGPVVPRRGVDTLARIQAASGAAFGLFLVLHLTTTISAVAGAGTYDRTLALLRGVYRPRLAVELVLVALSGAVHVGCALARMARRREVFAVKGPGWMRAHRLSGYFLLATVISHAVATRVLPSSGTGGGADFAFLAYAVLGWPWFFGPYYLLLGISGAVHLGVGFHLAGRLLIPGRVESAGPSRRYLVIALALALAVTVGSGAIITRAPTSPRQRFGEYRGLYQRFAPLLLRHRADGPPALPSP